MLFNNKISSTYLINLSLFLIPVSYIAGNLILNLNIIILIIIALASFGKEIFLQKMALIDKLLILIFAYIVLNGFLNNAYNFNFLDSPDKNIVLKKSLLYIRFLFLYFVIKFLIFKRIINYNFLFLIFGGCSLFVSIDIIFQYLVGFDLLGFEGGGRRLSGPFGEEYVAGSFIQRFFIFLPFFIIFFSKIEKKYVVNIIFLIIFLLSILGAFFSGNRMPLLLLVMTLILTFLFQKALRNTLIIMFVIFMSGYLYLVNNNENFSDHYKGFFYKTSQIINYYKAKTTSDSIQSTNVYLKEFESGRFTWEKNKVFGGGIKSFFWHCSTIEREKMQLFVSKRGGVNCNTHPHNYYLQIAAELGIIGLILIIFTFGYVVFKAARFMIFNEIVSKEKRILLPFFILLLIEIFPFKTTGSFFTTTNSTYIFIILAFVIGLVELKQTKKL